MCVALPLRDWTDTHADVYSPLWRHWNASRLLVSSSRCTRATSDLSPAATSCAGLAEIDVIDDT